MRFLRYDILLASLAVIFVSCGGDAPNDPANPSTLEMTVPAQCFQLEVDGMDEYWSVQIQDNKLKATGNRVFHVSGSRFIIKVTGDVLPDGQSKVTLTASSEDDTNFAATSYEIWRIDDQKIYISDRVLKDEISQKVFSGSFDGNKINCAGTEQPDTTLFDQLDGFYNGYAIAKRKGQYYVVNDKKEVTAVIHPKYLVM